MRSDELREMCDYADEHGDCDLQIACTIANGDALAAMQYHYLLLLDRPVPTCEEALAIVARASADRDTDVHPTTNETPLYALGLSDALRKVEAHIKRYTR